MNLEGKACNRQKHRRWILKVKHARDRSIETYKAKFVEKWYSQVEEIDMRIHFLL